MGSSTDNEIKQIHLFIIIICKTKDILQSFHTFAGYPIAELEMVPLISMLFAQLIICKRI